MPTTLRDQIATAALGLLNSSPPAGIPATERSRTFAVDIAAQAAKSLILYLGIDTASRIGRPPATGPQGGGTMQRELQFFVEACAKGTSSTTAEQEVDALCSHAVKRLGEQISKPLFYLIEEVSTGPPELDQHEHQYCLCRVEFKAHYVASASNPELSS